MTTSLQQSLRCIVAALLWFAVRGVSGQMPAIEYTFNNDTVPTENTGIAVDPSDGVINTATNSVSNIGAGVTFVDNAGKDGSTAADFPGTGCMLVPDNVDVNTADVFSRTISLEFNLRDFARGTRQVLFEEGGNFHGINLFLFFPTDAQRDPELWMGAWRSQNNAAAAASVSVMKVLTSTEFELGMWYEVSFVLDASNNQVIGFFEGVEFQNKAFSNFPILSHAADNSVGGRTMDTRFLDSGANLYVAGTGSFFNGTIDNFRLVNSVVLPTEAPTASPTSSPTVSPTQSPTISPTVSPTSTPTQSPTASPTANPTKSPTNSPTASPTASPTSSKSTKSKGKSSSSKSTKVGKERYLESTVDKEKAPRGALLRA